MRIGVIVSAVVLVSFAVLWVTLMKPFGFGPARSGLLATTSGAPIVGRNKVVGIEYTLKDTNGRVLDASARGKPLYYLHGQRNIVAGLERVLEGKAVGDRTSGVISPEDAYGVRDPRLVQSVPRANFQMPTVTPGMQMRATTSQETRIVTVVSVKGDEVTIDANHPLAGKTLAFDVRVVSVRDASAREVAQGFAEAPSPSTHSAGRAQSSRRPQGTRPAVSIPDDQLEAHVFKTIAELIGVAAGDLKRSQDFRRDLKADDLDVVELTMDLEDTLEMSIPDEDVEKLRTLGDWIDYVRRARKNAK